MVNQELIKFVKEARRRGFSDYEIREPLLKEGWPQNDINDAFVYIGIPRGKIKVCINLDRKVLEVIGKRAKRNMFSVEEQIEDIVRRSSAVTRVKRLGKEKIDDLLVSIFSRKRTGRKANG